MAYLTDPPLPPDNGDVSRLRVVLFRDICALAVDAIVNPNPAHADLLGAGRGGRVQSRRGRA